MIQIHEFIDQQRRILLDSFRQLIDKAKEEQVCFLFLLIQILLFFFQQNKKSEFSQ